MIRAGQYQARGAEQQSEFGEHVVFACSGISRIRKSDKTLARRGWDEAIRSSNSEMLCMGLNASTEQTYVASPTNYHTSAYRTVYTHVVAMRSRSLDHGLIDFIWLESWPSAKHRWPSRARGELAGNVIHPSIRTCGVAGHLLGVGRISRCCVCVAVPVADRFPTAELPK